MTIDRPDPPFVADERTILTGFLDFHRATLRIKCDGLTPEQLTAASAPPSAMSLLGLVRHLADIEQGWFKDFAGEAWAPHFEPGDGFTLGADVDVAETFAVFERECDASRRIVAGFASLDEARDIDGRTFSLRWILVHMIEEYARHNGHADLLRERIDGATGE